MSLTPNRAEPIETVREFIDAWDAHDIDAILSYLPDEDPPYTTEEMQSVAQDWFRGFPDLSHQVKTLVQDGEWVVGRLRLTGTHEGEFMGVPPTGRRIEVDDNIASRVVAGELREHHATADLYTLFTELGVTLPPAETHEERGKALVRRYFEALNDRDQAAFRETLAPTFTYGDLEGPEEMVAAEWAWLEAFDLHWAIAEMVADGDRVATRLQVTGTHVGEHLGLEATGESFEIEALTMCEVGEDGIEQWWGTWEFAKLLDQIGAIDVAMYTD